MTPASHPARTSTARVAPVTDLAMSRGRFTSPAATPTAWTATATASAASSSPHSAGARNRSRYEFSRLLVAGFLSDTMPL
jgi:hypothetical protein